MRILHVVESLAAGGAERQLVNVITGTSPFGVEHVVVALGGSQHVAGELRQRGYRVENLDVKSSWPALPAARRVRRLVQLEDPDIVHSWMFHGDVAARLALSGRVRPPLVTSVQTAPYEPEVRKAAGWPRHSVALRRFVDASTARLTRTTFVACSQFVARSCIKRLRVSPERVRHIYNAVQYGDLVADTDGRSIRRKVGIGSDAFVIGNVARLDRGKGQYRLIEAFVVAARQRDDLHLLIVGAGPLEDALRERAAAAGLADRVHLLGLRGDVGPVLHALDLFAFPSLFEGLPLAVIEAMAVGVPVIASSVGPLPEIISHGATGLLVAPQDTDGWASAIIDLAGDEPRRESLGRAGRDHVLRHFTIDATRQAWTDLYEQLARDGRR
jgi:glycosyltransferase involved in cell wall biosynthesis